MCQIVQPVWAGLRLLLLLLLLLPLAITCEDSCTWAMLLKQC
jgi:hypothetical protein